MKKSKQKKHKQRKLRSGNKSTRVIQSPQLSISFSEYPGAPVETFSVPMDVVLQDHELRVMVADIVREKTKNLKGCSGWLEADLPPEEYPEFFNRLEYVLRRDFLLKQDI